MPLTDSADLVLHYAPRSRAFTLLWFMEELGRPYRLAHVDIRQGAQKHPEFLAINPMGKVPAVTDAGVSIAETGAILVWLADRYSPGELAPHVDAPARADYLRWLFFVGGVVEPAYGQKVVGYEMPAMQAGWGSFDTMAAVVTDAVKSREWLAGDRFTAADLYVGAALNFGVQFGILAGEGPIADYIARLTVRPAFARAMAIEADFVAEQEKGTAG